MYWAKWVKIWRFESGSERLCRWVVIISVQVIYLFCFINVRTQMVYLFFPFHFSFLIRPPKP